MDKIWFTRTGQDVYIFLDKGYYYYLRMVFEYYGNTPEARKLYKKIKRLLDNQKWSLVHGMNNHIEQHLYNGCGNRTYNDLMEAFIMTFNRYKGKERDILFPYLKRYKLIIKRLTEW